jgi:hypothetical protein
MHNNLSAHLRQNTATNLKGTGQQHQFVHGSAQALPSLNELGSNSEIPQPDPSPNKLHPNVLPGVLVADSAQEAILAGTFAIGAAVLRMKIPRAMPFIS